MGAGANCDPLREGAKSPAPQTGCGVLLVHRLHNGTYDRGKDRAAARAANCIAEKAAQRPARSRIGTCRATKEATKNRTSGDTADGTADDLGQRTDRYLLQDRTDGLTAEDASYNLNDNR